MNCHESYISVMVALGQSGGTVFNSSLLQLSFSDVSVTVTLHGHSSDGPREERITQTARRPATEAIATREKNKEDVTSL